MSEEKYYKVSESEYKELLRNQDWGKSTPREVIESDIEEILKDKQPIELVAEVQPSGCARHLLIKEFNKTEIGLYQSKIKHKYIFKKGKYKVFVSECGK